MSIDDIVDMVAVRNCLMSTLSAVGMARVVSGARMGRRAASRIRLARGENVLVDVSLVAHHRPDSVCGSEVAEGCTQSRLRRRETGHGPTLGAPASGARGL